jgi:glyoxylase-like metal-dependent hydrolase (beta-lactamase superfamily II)
MSVIPFVPPLTDPRYGEATRVSPLVRRVIAENPGKYSYTGTGTYILGNEASLDSGRGDVVVIDPGPRIDSHREALERALAHHTVRAILVTHCHADHSPLAGWLHDRTGAPRIAFGPHGDIGEPDDDDIELPPSTDAAGHTPGVEAGQEESIDLAFEPDVVARDGDVVHDNGGLTITAVHTPGHTSNHLCFALAQERALFTGDHVMGWSTTVVAPPNGNMAHYMSSLQRLLDREDAVLWPTHGNPVTEPHHYVRALLAHRVEREAQILTEVRSGSSRIRDIVSALYGDVRPELHKPAARSVLAHLVKLIDEGTVVTSDRAAPRLRSGFRAV